MTWFKVDDNLAFHQKVMIAGNEAMGLWVRAGSWCGQQLSDGFVPAQIATMIAPAEHATALVNAGLWDAVEGGFQFHQWSSHQPLRSEVEERRERDRERKADARAAKASKRNPQGVRPDSAGNPGGVREESALPVPSRPVPTRPVTSNTDQSGQETLPADSSDKTDQLIPALISEIRHELGIDATADEARHWAQYVLGHAKTPPRNPKSYLLASLYNSRDEQTEWFAKHRRHLKAVGNG